MTPRKMRKLTLGEKITLTVLACQMRETVDVTAGDLVDRIAAGDDTALIGLVDRLKDIGREEQAERLKALLTL